MLKMFHQLPVGGGSTEFWERSWVEGDYAESARFCLVDPLRPLLERNIRPGSVMLEGGCGRGLYVAHHAARGVHAIGLDFAMATLSDVKHRYPTLLLGAADVAQLPLQDRSVDVYYSGGVVEHFESGPHAAVSEAARVLKRDGVLLISVPYFSPLRRALGRFRRRGWRVTSSHAIEPPPRSYQFFQYAYTPGEFESILSSSGFAVLGRQGYSILWGLYEVPAFGRVLKRVTAKGGKARPAASLETIIERLREGAPEPRQSLVRRIAISEDDTIPLAGSAVRLLRWFAANMMMYECELLRTDE